MSTSPWEIMAVMMTFFGDVIAILAIACSSVLLLAKLSRTKFGRRLARMVRLWELAVATTFFGTVGLFSIWMSPGTVAEAGNRLDLSPATIGGILGTAILLLILAAIVPMKSRQSIR